jgi:polysaccharide biosynthesis/export protein
MIRMPLLEQDIRAACRTENELAHEISRLYQEHSLLKNPAVYVSVKDYQSQPVAILGSVNNPGRFVLRRRVQLLEMVVFVAGGPSTKAGRKIQILSTSPAESCNASEAGAGQARTQGEEGMVTYDLQDVLAGKETANPFIQRGDIINIPAAEEAFVVGNVLRPSAIPIVGAITIGRALATVGGTLPNTRKDRIRVIRQIPGSTSTSEILVDLASTEYGKGTDFLLQGGDIIQVDTKTGVQNVLKGIMRALVPTASALPLQVMRY